MSYILVTIVEVDLGLTLQPEEEPTQVEIRSREMRIFGYAHSTVKLSVAGRAPARLPPSAPSLAQNFGLPLRNRQ